MELLRLAGAPGVGKSTTGWAMAVALADDGVAAGYIDIDQLGMCYPAPDGDPDRWALKERALADIAQVFRDAGVTRLVVSGVAQAATPLPPIPNVSVRAVWLDASAHVRRERLAVRRLAPSELERSLAAGSAEDGQVDPAWLRVSTEDRSESETVTDVSAAWDFGVDAEEPAAVSADARSRDTGASHVLWLTGPRLAGASRIGWEIASESWSKGIRTGFADLAQLSFTWNIAGDVGLLALRCLHDRFQDAGADFFVVVAPLNVTPAAVHSALPQSRVSFVRLAPSKRDLVRHASSRHDGGPLLAGDDVRGATTSVIDALIERSAADFLKPLRAHERRVDTEDLSLSDAVAAVQRAAAW